MTKECVMCHGLATYCPHCGIDKRTPEPKRCCDLHCGRKECPCVSQIRHQAKPEEKKIAIAHTGVCQSEICCPPEKKEKCGRNMFDDDRDGYIACKEMRPCFQHDCPSLVQEKDASYYLCVCKQEPCICAPEKEQEKECSCLQCGRDCPFCSFCRPLKEKEVYHECGKDVGACPGCQIPTTIPSSPDTWEEEFDKKFGKWPINVNPQVGQSSLQLDLKEWIAAKIKEERASVRASTLDDLMSLSFFVRRLSCFNGKKDCGLCFACGFNFGQGRIWEILKNGGKEEKGLQENSPSKQNP